MFDKKYYNNKRKKLKPYCSDKLYANHRFHSTSFTIEKDKYIKNKRKIFSFNYTILKNKLNKSIHEYSKFKHNIYLNLLKEERQKNKIRNEALKELKSNDLNYTKILEFVDKAVNKENPFKDNDFQNKINLIKWKNLENSIKDKKIKDNLSKKILFDSKIKSKIDSGITKEASYQKLYQKINNLKKNFEKRNLFQKKSNSALNKYQENCRFKDKQNQNEKKIIQKNSDISKQKEENITNNKTATIDQTISNNNSNNSLFNLDYINRMEKKSMRSNSLIEINGISKIKEISEDLFYNKLRDRSSKSFHFKNRKFSDKIFSNNSKSSKNLDKISILKPTSILNFKGNRKINRYNNYIKRTTKFVSFNKPEVKYKANTINDEYKKNKYITLLDDIYRKFKKIKVKTINLKYKFNKWEMPSYKNVDSIINSNEDMLIFKLKQKYFAQYKNIFAKKKEKKSHELVKQKLKASLNFIDNED